MKGGHIMEATICVAVLIAWLLMLLGWGEFFVETLITIIKKEFILLDALIVFWFLVALSVFVFWLGIAVLS